MLSRLGKMLRILVLMVSLIMLFTWVSLYVAPSIISFLPEPLSKLFKEVQLQPAQSMLQVFYDLMKFHGYEKCGEYVLKLGINHVDIYGVTDKPMKCYYVFKLPEPRDQYVLYLPWGELWASYIRDEDSDKPFRFSFGSFGSIQMPDPRRGAALAPFYAETIGSVATFHDGFISHPYLVHIGSTKDGKSPAVGASYELITQDGLMVLALKPEEGAGPIRYWAVFHGIVYRKDEGKILMPTPIERYTFDEVKSAWKYIRENMSVGGPAGDLAENAFKGALEHLESLGYRGCGRYSVSGIPGENLNITYVIDDPYKGEACYFIIESNKTAGLIYNSEIYPVISENMSRTELKNVKIYYRLEVKPIRHVIYHLLGHPTPEWVKTHAFAEETSRYEGSWTRYDNYVKEYSKDDCFRRELILLHFKLESPERADVKIVFKMNITIKPPIEWRDIEW